MKLLDLDMDYFMENIATGIAESKEERLSEEEYGDYVWSEQRVRDFLENNLGLSKDKRIKGRIVAGHNEALFFWQELIETKSLETPFEVVHVDSHADLGLGYLSWTHILDYLLQYSVEERLMHTKYVDCWLSMKSYSTNNCYLKKVLEHSKNESDFEEHIYLELANEDFTDPDFEKLYIERKKLLERIPERLPLIARYCEKLGKHEKDAVYYLTDRSETEEFEFIRCLCIYEYTEDQLHESDMVITPLHII